MEIHQCGSTIDEILDGISLLQPHEEVALYDLLNFALYDLLNLNFKILFSGMSSIQRTSYILKANLYLPCGAAPHSTALKMGSKYS